LGGGVGGGKTEQKRAEGYLGSRKRRYTPAVSTESVTMRSFETPAAYGPFAKNLLFHNLDKPSSIALPRSGRPERSLIMLSKTFFAKLPEYIHKSWRKKRRIYRRAVYSSGNAFIWVKPSCQARADVGPSSSPPNAGSDELREKGAEDPAPCSSPHAVL